MCAFLCLHCLHLCLSVCLSMCLYVSQSVCLSVLSVCLSVCQSVCTSICLSLLSHLPMVEQVLARASLTKTRLGPIVNKTVLECKEIIGCKPQRYSQRLECHHRVYIVFDSMHSFMPCIVKCTGARVPVVLHSDARSLPAV
jgi:hypothetical protein